MTISLPYGKGTLTYTPHAGQRCQVMRKHVPTTSSGKSPQKIIEDSMASPIGSFPLWELAKEKSNIVIIASDHTRPVPSKLIIPLMLSQLRMGNPQAKIRILIATGCHRSPTRQELIDKFGSEILAQEEVLIHNCEDEENLVHVGTLPSGGKLELNRVAIEADLLVSEGFIEPHFFAGFSGGRKSVLPGIASRTCVHYNHNSGFMDHPMARAGCLAGNPIHTDMVYAARAAKLAYIVNVVLDEKGMVAASFSGDCELAHKAGAAYVEEQMGCPALPAPIVITTNNGYPMDQNIYQMVKGMCTAESVCIPGGVIIAVGKCEDGAGGEGFLRTFREASSSGEILRNFRHIPPAETITDQWQSHILARILEQYTVILVSDADAQIVKDLHLLPAASLEEAVDLAETILGQTNCSITVIPEGISVIVLPPAEG